MNRSESVDRILGLGLILLVFFGCFIILRPFLTAVLWAAILTFSTWPAHLRLKEALNGRRTASASIMTVAIAILVVAPFVIVAAALADNSVTLATAARGFIDQGLPDPPSWLSELPLVGASLEQYWRGLAHDGAALVDEARRLLPALRRVSLIVGESLGLGLVQLGLSVFLAFFLYRDGESVARQLRGAGSRLVGERAQRLFEVAGGTVISVVYGILGTALAQGMLTGIGLAIAGVPAAPLLGLAVFFLSIVPVGPPLVWLSASAWLLWNDSVGWAIFMLLWGFFVISSVDNVIKPWLISRGARLPFATVLLGVAGGALTFGFIGVFIGPTLLAVGTRLLAEWTERASEGSSVT
ncbi:MAG: AI-2E family transporter [Betaproteobacteria bacterium]|nr:MAG: AI-2E family transporter [Betaproteobacteria bacterium]